MGHRCGGLLLLLVIPFVLPAGLSAQALRGDDLLKQAAEREKRHDWLEACRLYDELLRRGDHRSSVREGYQCCLRRYHIVHRHQDGIYQRALRQLEPAQALELYANVLETIGKVYADRQKSSPAELFRHGLEELSFALDETVFAEKYLPDVSRKSVADFKHRLQQWRERKIDTRAQARDQVSAVGRAAQQMGFGPRPLLLTVIALEFVSGACNALDEYTFFLTPGRYREVQAALSGRLVSIGVDVAVIDNQMEIVRVYPNSPAAEANLQVRDQIVSIDGRGTDRMTADEAAERLRGKSGSKVALEIVSYAQMDAARTVEVKRRPVIVPSVGHDLIQSKIMIDGREQVFWVGKITINYFQESTLQEVKDALALLQDAGVRALILDLRGNPGGLFKSAVQTAELFLPTGLIVVSQTHVQFKDRRMSGPIRAENMTALLIPMVVWVDSETASAAEVLAGALKENHRARLVGQTTFGKGSIQCILPLDKPHFERMPGGIRITVAKLLSPSWQPYSGKGIQPNVPAPAGDENHLLDEALQILRDELRANLQPMPMTQ